MKLGKYPKYRDSGVEWIGEIPEGWKVVRFKYLFNYLKGKTPLEQKEAAETGLYPYLTMDYLRNKQEASVYAPNTDDSVLVEDNDLLLLWDGSNAGEFVLGKKGILSSTMAKLYPNQAHEKNFLSNAAKATEIIIKDLTNGMGVPHVSSAILVNMRIPIPNNRNQEKTITAFLEFETSKLQQLIDLKYHQIELLQEHEKSLIHQAVTKGLDPNAKMKDSGVEWIGKMPEGWATERFKYVCDYEKGKAPAEFLDTASINALPYLEMEYLRGKPEPKYTTLSNNSVTVDDGDLLLLWDGSKAGEFVVGKHGILSSTMAKISEKKKMHSLKYVVKSFESILIDLTNGMGIPHVRSDILMNMRVPVAPDNEDKQIAIYLDTQTSKIHQAINNIENQIEKLEEYRKSLIYEVVTGKVKVG